MLKIIGFAVLAFIIWFIGGVIFKTKRNLDHYKKMDKK